MIAFPMATVMQLTGEPATYTPPAGSPVSCKAIRFIPARMHQAGGVRVTADASVYHVLRSEIPSPVEGATLLVDEGSLTIDAVEPAEDDPQNLIWQVTAGWGVTTVWRRTTGGGDTQHPPDGYDYTAAAASAGASTVTVASPYAVGKLLAGDTFTIAGDVTVYTVQGEITADSAGFTNVSISPVLANPTSGGEAVTFIFSSEKTVRAALGDYEAQELFGGITAGDRRIVVRQTAVIAASRTDIQLSDTFTISGDIWGVQSARAIYEGDALVAWDAQVRR